MQKISILTLCYIVLTVAQQQPQVAQQQPQVVSQQPQVVSQQPQVVSQQPRVVPPQPKTPTKTENEHVASPFNVINLMYDVTPLRVKVFNWFSSWFSTPTPFG